MTQRILLTAGAAGIGRAIAEAFLADGADVAICDVDSDQLAAMQEAYPTLIAGQVDVTNEAEMDAFLQQLKERWQGIDVVCANAGTGGPAGRIETLDFDEWQHCVATNLHGSFLTCRWAARLMRAQGSGLICLTSSTAGQMGYPLRSPYASAKWAIVGLTKTLAMELGEAGVRVNAICPGAVEGPRMDRVIENEASARRQAIDAVRQSYVKGVSMKAWVTAQDVANTIRFLASPSGSKISGQILAVDGHTETLAP
ncbi:SDR family oxidoreductase [Yoonia sp.]|nr:SDR family oxidoreductase [Yoonia sp.]